MMGTPLYTKYYEGVTVPPLHQPGCRAAAVRFNVRTPTNFGEEVKVVGSAEQLGNWDINRAPMLKWTEDHWWRAELNLPTDQVVEYKVILLDHARKRTGDSVIWQEGSNQMLHVPSSQDSHVVEIEWEPPSTSTPNHDEPSTKPELPEQTKVSTRQKRSPKRSKPVASAPKQSPPKTSVRKKTDTGGQSSTEIETGIPSWFRESVVYHIQTLGFFGVEDEPNDGTGPVGNKLQELAQWYPHLEELGVNTVYFGPLFESSTHGYDTADYFKIDRRLGDVALFKQVVDDLHARGIRVIVDGVFNHTGRRFFAFEDLLKKGTNSQYADWYRVRPGKSPLGDPFAYDAWEGHAALPRLNLKNNDVREHIFSVARFWLGKVGIDGWRLDVAHEIEPEFWAAFRPVCKKARADSITLGEIIHGDYHKWVGPGLLDTCTNYQLSKAIWSSLNDANYFELAHCVQRELDMYGSLDALLNFVGNHDVPRLASKLKTPEHFFVAMLFLLTMRGVPCLYYGDEAGMKGEPGGPRGDTAMRMPLAFDHTPENDRKFQQTAQLVRLRRSSPALMYGSMQLLGNSNTHMTFLRRTDSQVAIVVLNCAASAASITIDLSRCGLWDGLVLKDALNGDAACTLKNGRLELPQVAAASGSVLLGSL
ncbi:glycoside hydrolase family 13 protein [Klebsormidium nitens]|uniref:Glycoside hydrolase family 13 protein n=1 Tax=Klebsormidium nitens TaxID=105231 RepID=A0A1Y1IF06_KLENI|nr:glycoside hydrolase family 13 protein [Klebsormidium nitens]|eukprot:GAQ88582.1 glycoside hydrolase family 13 protein [Klebsormidium nitens]